MLAFHTTVAENYNTHTLTLNPHDAAQAPAPAVNTEAEKKTAESGNLAALCKDCDCTVSSDCCKKCSKCEKTSCTTEAKAENNTNQSDNSCNCQDATNSEGTAQEG
jgi:hypothetical protein